MGNAANIQMALETCALLSKMDEQYQKETDEGSTNLCWPLWLETQNVSASVTALELKVDERIKRWKQKW